MDIARYYVVPLTSLFGVLGFVLGGGYVWLGAATFPALMVLDILLPKDFAPRKIHSAVAADIPLYLHLLMMFAMYAAFIRSVNIGINPLTGAGSGWQIAGSFASISWLSAVPTLPAAHELMHRRHWLPRKAAVLLNTFYGDPNRDVGHVMTHHIHLDTPADSDTPRRGETMYAFALRASWGAYKDAFETEATRLRRAGKSAWHWSNRAYREFLLLSAIPLACLGLAGVPAMFVSFAVIVYAKVLIEGFNYFQHYGLMRVSGAPIEKRHAWNHMGTIVRPLGLEITNHINHHLDSYTRYYDLKPEPEAPQMPSLFLCFLLGLFPPLWFRFIAKPRLEDWDRRYASRGEKKLAMDANDAAGWPKWTEPQPSVN